MHESNAGSARVLCEAAFMSALTATKLQLGRARWKCCQLILHMWHEHCCTSRRLALRRAQSIAHLATSELWSLTVSPFARWRARSCGIYRFLKQAFKFEAQHCASLLLLNFS